MNIIKIADITLLIWRGTLKQVSWLKGKESKSAGETSAVSGNGGGTHQ